MMEAKEVLTHVANLEKAVREKLPSSHLIDVLKSLKDGVVASEKLLRVSDSFCSRQSQFGQCFGV
jgi:transcription elongation factor S-II